MCNQKRVKWGCYATGATMSVAANLPPLLFVTFHNAYGVSYTLLGLLVLINFSTQLLVDLIFSFFSHKFNIPKTVTFTPFLSAIGLFVFACAPWFSEPYVILAIGTIILSAGSGLAEVLMSPTIAALPSDNPEREMSALHSVYAWGVVFVVIFSSLCLTLFGTDCWQYLAFFFSIIPLTAFFLFLPSDVPSMPTPKQTSGAISFLKRKELLICLFGIFLGGAAECTMSQWASSYIEQALHIPKLWGDILGVAMFGVTLGLGRTLYAKFGKRIERVLLLGGIGAFVCYLLAIFSPFAWLSLFACAFTGFCTSMLWPGSLIVSSERVPDGGVFIYAIMAAGGDFGASVAPQGVGILSDLFSMKAGMAFGAIFPLLSIFVYFYIWKSKYSANVPQD